MPAYVKSYSIKMRKETTPSARPDSVQMSVCTSDDELLSQLILSSRKFVAIVSSFTFGGGALVGIVTIRTRP